MRRLMAGPGARAIALLIWALAWLAVFLGSMVLGKTPIAPETAIASLKHYDPQSMEHLILHTERLPRAVIASAVGACLAVAGALMQALTRNPLASPGILGVNAGAIFFVVAAVVLLSVHSLAHQMWFGFAGAAFAAFVVYALAAIGRDGLTPLKTVLAGTAVAALFASLTQSLLVMNESGLQDVLYWLAGSVSGRTLAMLAPVWPFMLAAGAAAMLMGRAVNVLLSGDDIARGLGQHVVLVKLGMAAAVVVLAGGSVAVVGAVGFVGLVVPHLSKPFAGRDYRWLLPFSAVIGATLLIVADVAARLVIMPQEVPIGVMTALLGGPFFVYIARKEAKRR